jgi:asparagine synthase (glutamine-hydrolysing)
MCGISGYFSRTSYPETVLAGMTGRLTHRGPDAAGYYHDGPVALGHRRLSVIDIEASTQPMSTPDGELTIVFNGEIYNFPALRTELEQRGHRFRTHGDTETLLYAYREWGMAMLDHLQGMFAFALWDKRQHSLFLARDHLGVKPLHYHWDGANLVFGSEIKAVVAHPAVSRELDLDALGLYLECQFIPAPKTIYRTISKLPPAHAMLLKDGKLKTWRYWLPDYSDKLVLGEQEALAQLETELRRSVESMLVADVPLGAFLSGGVDSSLIAALMADITGGPIDTFNLGFTGGVPGSEHEQAAQVARHIGSRHHPLMLAPSDVLGAFDDCLDILDEPFGDQAVLPTMLLAQLSRKHVTVVLTGEGADEVFCGYSNYQKRVRMERYSSVLGAKYSPLHHLVRHLPPALKKDRLLKAVGEPLARRYSTIPNMFDRALHGELFSPRMYREQHTDIADYAAQSFEQCNSAHYIDKLMYIDSTLWLPDDLLTKVDRATMAHSLEARVPYLDHRFFEFSARLDPALKQNGETRKYLLKKLAEKYLPHEIVHRTKQGFVMPLSEWLTGQLKDETLAMLSPQGLGRRGLLRPEALQKLLDQHYRGSKNHSGRLWGLLMLEKWFARHEPDFMLRQ